MDCQTVIYHLQEATTDILQIIWLLQQQKRIVILWMSINLQLMEKITIFLMHLLLLNMMLDLLQKMMLKLTVLFGKIRIITVSRISIQMTTATKLTSLELKILNYSLFHMYTTTISGRNLRMQT